MLGKVKQVCCTLYLNCVGSLNTSEFVKYSEHVSQQDNILDVNMYLNRTISLMYGGSRLAIINVQCFGVVTWPGFPSMDDPLLPVVSVEN